MSAFEENIRLWLSKTSVRYRVNICSTLPIALGTDIGGTRNENQDRIAVLRIGAKSAGGRPLLAVAVSDGMGGMREGSKSAELTIAGFFYGLLQYRARDTEERIKHAVKDTNEKINTLFGGIGGATLSGVIIDHNAKAWIVNVGDSRIYAVHNDSVTRLTVDDSFKEAVGGHGRELLQFMGMGTGIKPHITELNTHPQRLVITTDGAHEIDQSIFENILIHATTCEQTVRRLISVAAWCGGRDNASVAAMDFESSLSSFRSASESGIQIWDPEGTLSIMWLRDEEPIPISEKRQFETEDSTTNEDQQKEQRQISSTIKKIGPKKKVPKKKAVQLEIEIESPENSSNDRE